MQKLRIENWLLEVDLKKTSEFYRKDITICNCLYCQNYIKACTRLDSSILNIFNSLGINPTKPSQLSEFGPLDEGSYLYMGSYHIVGKLLEGPYCLSSDWNSTNTAQIQNFKIGFSKELLFVPEKFPNPILQMEFEAHIPLF